MIAARGFILAAVLSFGGTPAEAQLAEERCPPAPTLVIDGTVLDVAVPRAQCWPEIAATGAETCLTASVARCANQATAATATIRTAGQPIRALTLVPPYPGSPRAGDFQVCAIPPGIYDVVLCADDAEPIACAITVGANQTIAVRASRPLPTVRVRVRVDAVVIGTAGAEVTFDSGARAHRVGEHGRFELHRTMTVSDLPAPSDYVERDCYQRQPAPVRARGCGGCSSGGTPGLLGIAAVVALLRTRTRR